MNVKKSLYSRHDLACKKYEPCQTPQTNKTVCYNCGHLEADHRGPRYAVLAFRVTDEEKAAVLAAAAAAGLSVNQYLIGRVLC